MKEETPITIPHTVMIPLPLQGQQPLTPALGLPQELLFGRSQPHCVHTVLTRRELLNVWLQAAPLCGSWRRRPDTCFRITPPFPFFELCPAAEKDSSHNSQGQILTIPVLGAVWMQHGWTGTISIHEEETSLKISLSPHAFRIWP